MSSSESSRPQSDPTTSTSSLVWYGHLPCVCSSAKGCSSYMDIESDAFYNPLLPPNAPVKLQRNRRRPSIMESGSSFDCIPLSSQQSSSRSEELSRSRSGSESPASSTSSQSTPHAGFFRSVSNCLRRQFRPKASMPQPDQIEPQSSSAHDRPPAYPTEPEHTITHLQPPQYDEVEPQDAGAQDRPPAYSAQLEQTGAHVQSPPPFWSTSILEPGSNSGVSYYPGHCPAIDSSWGQMSVKIDPMDPRVVPRTILPFDETSFGTFAPLHPAMPYHLAFYHLHWARRAIEKRQARDGT